MPDLKTHFQRVYRYDVWANRELLAVLKENVDPLEQALSWQAHIIGAQWLWMGRCQQKTYSIEVWLAWSVDSCLDHLSEVSGLWERFIDDMAGSDLESQVGYTNSTGQPWISTVEEILAHLIAHGAYHRGQICAELRSSGIASPYTDFIHASRQDLV